MIISIQLIIEAVLAIMLLCLMLAVIYRARRATVRPLGKPDGAELFTVIAASGESPQLEQTVRGLLWLDENGELVSRVVIADCGLEPRTKKLAELLAEDSQRVSICSPGELPVVMEEFGWTENRER